MGEPFDFDVFEIEMQDGSPTLFCGGCGEMVCFADGMSIKVLMLEAQDHRCDGGSAETR